jgi:hypothetical protein
LCHFKISSFELNPFRIHQNMILEKNLAWTAESGSHTSLPSLCGAHGPVPVESSSRNH